MDKVKVIVIGAGNRGQAYTDIMKDSYGDKYQVVGVAEPICDRREYIKNKHGILEENCYESWEQILNVPKFADVALISTMDRMHYGPAMKALELGYHLLLEKPVSPTPSECVEIEGLAKKKGAKVVVCHVLRYTPFFMKLKQMVKDGAVGEIMSIMHIEGVGNVHQSHSFVRGNWAKTNESSPMILQKSCHDTDIIQWLLDDDCISVQSYGSLSYFTEKNAPVGAPERCMDGCPIYDECPYNAVKLYYDDKDNMWLRTTSTGKTKPDDEDVWEALKTKEYGKCVFRCNNDVVDHQVVNLLFKKGATASFTMNAFNKGGRQIRIMGTKGEIFGRAENEYIELFDFVTKKTTVIDCHSGMTSESITGGHGGGDEGIVRAFLDVLSGNSNAEQISGIEISCKNHLISLAAEKSRLENKIINPEDLR